MDRGAKRNGHELWLVNERHLEELRFRGELHEEFSFNKDSSWYLKTQFKRLTIHYSVIGNTPTQFLCFLVKKNKAVFSKESINTMKSST